MRHTTKRFATSAEDRLLDAKSRWSVAGMSLLFGALGLWLLLSGAGVFPAALGIVFLTWALGGVATALGGAKPGQTHVR